MIPRLNDLKAIHRVILYTSYGGKFGILCNNILDAQKFADKNIHNQTIYRNIAGYRIEQIEK